MTASGHTDAYTAFSEGMRLLADDNAHAAVIALEHARELEPAKGSVREALARAYFRTGRFAAAEEEFNATLDIEPVNDYAQYGVGLCRLKAGDRAACPGSSAPRDRDASRQRRLPGRARPGHRHRRRRRTYPGARRLVTDSGGESRPVVVLRPGRCDLAR